MRISSGVLEGWMSGRSIAERHMAMLEQPQEVGFVCIGAEKAQVKATVSMPWYLLTQTTLLL